MPFSPSTKEEALVRSRRCCCICHQFFGLYLDVHHIKPEADGGLSTLDNAVVLCHTCHGQAGHYNPRHPIGNKYKPSEIVRHRDEWWAWCESNPFGALETSPVRLVPSEITLPLLKPPLSNTMSLPISICVQNRSEQNVYAIWIRLCLASAGLGNSTLAVDNALGGPMPLNSNHIEPSTGRLLLRLESQGPGLPNYNFDRCALMIFTSVDGAIGYLGIQRLQPREQRIFELRIGPLGATASKALPLLIASMSESPEMWLLQDTKAFVLDVTIPECDRYRRACSTLFLLDVDYQKRD